MLSNNIVAPRDPFLVPKLCRNIVWPRLVSSSRVYRRCQNLFGTDYAYGFELDMYREQRLGGSVHMVLCAMHLRSLARYLCWASMGLYMMYEARILLRAGGEERHEQKFQHV